MATALKPSDIIQAEHRKQLQEVFKLNNFTESISNAIFVIKNSDLLSSKQKTTLDTDFFTPLIEFDEIDALGITSPQDRIHITNNTMEIVYKLGSRLMAINQVYDALSLFTLCTFLNPIVPCYWIGLMIGFFKQSHFAEALMASKIVTDLIPHQAVGFVYCILIKRKQDPNALIDEELAKIDLIFNEDINEKQLWESTLNSL